MSADIRLVTMPDDDHEFAELVQAAAARADGSTQPTRAAIMEALAGLRKSYPNLEVRQQNGLASFEAPPRTWYVYRDGGLRPERDPYQESNETELAL